MTFRIIKNCLARFIHGSGIDSPLNEVKDVSLTNLVSGVKSRWMSDRVRVWTSDVSFDLMYNGRSEAEIASEFLDMVEELQ